MIPFFVPPKESTSTPEIARRLPQRLPEAGGGVGDARAVHVQKHFMLMRELGQRLNLFRLVDRPHLGRLRNRDDPRLHMMLVADAVIGVAHGVERDLAVLMRQRNQLASRMLLRSAAFVGIDVRVVAAQHRVVRPVQRLQAQHVRAGSVEGEEDINPRTEVLFELRDRRTRVRIVAVSDDVSLVGACDRLQHLGMHSGIVVAGKAAGGLGKNLRHTETM